MPITLSEMAANKASITVTGGHLGDSTINLVYYPNKITASAIKQLDEGMDSINEVLASAIISWDVLEDDGSMFAVTSDNLARLGTAIVWQIRMEIIKDLRPNW